MHIGEGKKTNCTARGGELRTAMNKQHAERRKTYIHDFNPFSSSVSTEYPLRFNFVRLVSRRKQRKDQMETVASVSVKFQTAHFRTFTF